MKDELYLKSLADALKIKDIRSLSVVMGPEELKEVLSNLSAQDFDDGKRLITLHTHTTASDGIVSPADYLKNALDFKQKYGYRDLLLAVTDHDAIDALPIVLKEIHKNGKKYEGIRIVLGCELSVSYFDECLNRPVDFELLHYGLNPFDKDYAKWLESGRKTKVEALTKAIDLFQKRYPDAGLSLDEFLSKNPRDGFGFGCYIAYDAPRYIEQKVNDPSQSSFIWDYFRRLGYSFEEQERVEFWHTLDDTIEQVKKHRFGFLSLAHPYRIQLGGKVKESGVDFLNRFFSVLKNQGIEGMEIFYMNLHQPLSRSFDEMLKGSAPETETDRWVKTILDFANNNKMIKTGGTDSHGFFLAGRKRQLVQLLTQKLEEYKPLIREGYKILDKEVTLGMPAPCMPAKSAYENSGIGSSYGDGAKRINSFFGGLFDKIQLGPMGRTNSKAKHSPYNSDIRPNPFFIPLERLFEDKLISHQTLKAIYDIPKQSNQIDFDLVEKIYDDVLKEAYENSKSKLSFDDFIADLVERYQKDIAVKYIADLQVHIPYDTPGISDDLFLPEFSLGAPGDDFSSKVRNWGFKVFNPELLFDKDGNLGPAGKVWYNLINLTIKNAAGGIRVDHYIGFVNPFVIREGEEVAGRLYSSEDIPQLSPFVKTDFSDITRKILLKCLYDNGLNTKDVYVEDLGSRPSQLDGVMNECQLGRLLIAQFWEPSNYSHMYHLSTSKYLDVACLDTHDLPSIQSFFEMLPWEKQREFAWGLAQDLRFNYNDDLMQLPQLVRMQWGALLACPAKRVQAFFTSWTGQEGRYNQSGNPIKWKLRCDVDFERLYFENLAKGLAYNPFDAIALAIYARGDEFYQKNEAFVHKIRKAEEEILNLVKEM